MKTPSSNAPLTRQGAFTLIEMLAVVAIILIMASLLFPYIIKFVRSGQNRVTETQASTLVNAIKSYRTTYRRWPGQTQSNNDITYATTNHLAILAPLTNNPRRIVFIELKPEMLSSNMFVDSWGRPYHITMDENGDNNLNITITTTTAVGVVNMNIRGQTVGILSTGAEPTDTNRWLFSWIR